MTTADWALIISIGSLAISASSFIWNVWSKFIYPKPKLKVSFGIFVEAYSKVENLSLTATNYGPTEVTLHTALTRRLLRPFKYAFAALFPLPGFGIEVASGTPFAGGLPRKLAVGEQFSVYLATDHEHLRDQPVSDIGFTDTFGRFHWAPRRQLREVRESLRAKKVSPSQRVSPAGS